jgi:hypothetical protein
MSQGEHKRKKLFKSKYDSETCWAYFMAYGVIWSISMSAFEEGALSLELPLSRQVSTLFHPPMELMGQKKQ